jgi:NitT/TauT family transport system substrate-binding protein
MRTKRRWTLSAILALLIALVAVGCGDDDEAGGSSDDGDGGGGVVRFQGLPADPAAIPLLVMQEEGIDEEHGFTAEFVEVDPDAAANTLLLGESDIAMEQDAVTMTLAQQEGEAGVVFWPVLNTMMSVVVPEDSDAQSPEDLVGRKVGHFGVDSGTTSVIALMLQELYGIDVFKDYDLREAGPAALPELLKGGEVDAIFDYEPLALRAVIEAPGRYLFEPAKAWAEENEGWSPYLTNLAARVDWLEENPDLALAAKDAWVEAVEVIEESNYEIFAEEPYRSFLDLRSDEELEAFIDYCADLPCYVNEWSEQDIEQLNNWLELMAKNDVLIDAPPKEPVAVILEDFLGESGGDQE